MTLNDFNRLLGQSINYNGVEFTFIKGRVPTLAEIDEACNKLGDINFEKDYLDFLKRFGCGNFFGIKLYDVRDIKRVRLQFDVL